MTDRERDYEHEPSEPPPDPKPDATMPCITHRCFYCYGTGWVDICVPCWKCA